MEMDGIDPRDTLAAVRRRAEQVLKELLEEQVDLIMHPPAVSIGKLAGWEARLAAAIASCREVIASAEETLCLPSSSSS